MKGMILSAGVGSRLGEITKRMPKCLVPVAGRPMLDHVVERFIASGIGSIIINVHHLPQAVKDHVAAMNSYGVEVEFSDEPELLGTGGGVKKIASRFENDEGLVLYNCDVYSDAPLSKLIESFRSTPALSAVVGTQRASGTRGLLFDTRGFLHGWESRKGRNDGVFSQVRQGNMALPESCLSSTDGLERIVIDESSSFQARFRHYCGISVLRPSIIPALRDNEGEFSIITTYLKAARAQLPIQECMLDGSYWIDMGSPEKLSELEARLHHAETGR